MQYKTICLQMIQDRREMFDQLRGKRILLSTLERLASELRTSHLAWKDLLFREKPGSSESQIASEALEIALKELEECLPPVYPQDEDEPFSLDAAMAFLRAHTPPG